MNCSEMYNCCDCGGQDCGCGYCFSCKACENCTDGNDERCIHEENEKPEKRISNGLT